MADKIEFVKWMFRNINYYYVFLMFHCVACFSVVFLPDPYEKWFAIYVLSTFVICAFYYCIVLPIKWAYRDFKIQQQKEDCAIKVPLVFSTKDRYKL